MGNVRAYLAIQACTVLFGLSALMGEQIQSDITAVVLGRGAFALLFLGALLCLFDRSRTYIPWRDRSKLLLNGALLAGHWFCFFMGVKAGGVAIGTLGFATFPAFVIMIEAVLSHKKPALFDMLLVTMIVAGVYILAPMRTENAGSLTGLLWALGSGFIHALVIIFNRYLRIRASAIQSSWWQCAGCALVTLPGGLAGLVHSSGHDLVFIGLLGILCTGLAYWMLTWGLRTLQASTVSMMIVLEPVYAVLLAWIFLHQQPGGQTLMGAVLIIGASVLSVWLPARRRGLTN
ncbi:threonine/homoserine efflux transporter RhtA [Raoultella sp. BIGb0399]|uniref:DMT family transporter n=1 Tax=Raoultella lignicola TaxID=3040939 RepID=A0ABU9FBG3_9ENTR|nr:MULTISPECIES: DMT family transporter [Enterobacteriaceae]QNK09522.1 DMT family transporter [Enterobacter sp. JUb54]ROS15235.1 threonine/homoserine efflux transporter RhtA [Raoultella sp. BIGb0399]